MKAQLIYNITPLPMLPAQIQSTYVSSFQPLTLPTNPITILQLTKEECINALERELLALHKKQVFDGVEIVQWPLCTVQNNGITPLVEPQPATINEHQPSPPVEQDTEATSDPPVHPYSNIPKAYFTPAVGDTSTGPSMTSNGKEPSYCTVIPIQDLKIIDDVYKRAMKALSVTVSHEELLSLSPNLPGPSVYLTQYTWNR